MQTKLICQGDQHSHLLFFIRMRIWINEWHLFFKHVLDDDQEYDLYGGREGSLKNRNKEIKKMKLKKKYAGRKGSYETIDW